MKKYLKKLKCKLGFHKWTDWETDSIKIAADLYKYGESRHYDIRHCTRCRKIERD